MEHILTGKHKGFFVPLIESDQAQAAVMVLSPGQSSSEDATNEHPHSEQWLFVISGTGRATVGKRSVSLKPGSLLLIERGELHRITGTGKSPLSTINFYSPPAYTHAGNVKRRAKR